MDSDVQSADLQLGEKKNYELMVQFHFRVRKGSSTIV